MATRILSDRQNELLISERHTMDSLRTVLAQFDAAQEDLQTLILSIQQLDELFLLVVVGEFNAGKSAFINALLGSPYLKEGVTPTTTQINLLRYGDSIERIMVDENQFIQKIPIEWLKDISIVDTPGTNAIIREHEVITSKFVPRSDMVLFVTSADRPFTESERAFLERIRDWGKKVVIVINKIDILQSSEELNQVENYVTDNARLLINLIPEVFSVSSREALRGKQGDVSLWNKSNFEPLERYIYTSLDETSRIRLKFLNPLGVGEHLVNKYLEITNSRLDLLKVDFDTISDVESQLAIYKEDMQREFKFRMSDIENVLYEMEHRGEDYFDETFRLVHILDLISKEKIRKQFETTVVADAPRQIEQKVNELVDWLVESDLRQWQAVNEHLSERRKKHQGRIVGDPGTSSFTYDRERLIDAISKEAIQVVETFNKEEEARKISESAQNAVAASAALEISAIGLGTIITVLATTMAADVTGILMASMIAIIGLFVIPTRRRMAKTEMRQKIESLRSQLITSLSTHFEGEIERSLQRIYQAIGPYTRFIRSERNKLNETSDSLEQLRLEINRLKQSISDLK